MRQIATRLSPKRIWLTNLDASTCGVGYYRFFRLREALDSIAGQAMETIETMESLALDGHLETAAGEFFQFWEKIQKTKDHFEKDFT